MTKVAAFHMLAAAFFTYPFLFSFSFLASGVEGVETHGVFGRTIDRKLMGLKKEKLIHFKLHWQEVGSGKKPTSIRVVQPVNGSLISFGLVQVYDNALTIGPDPGSNMVGRAQGLFTQAGQNNVALLMAQNFVFVEGKYHGSTITVLGRNPVFDAMREMPIVGGSGLFRFARGYVQIRTHTFDSKTLDSIIEYNVYVFNY